MENIKEFENEKTEKRSKSSKFLLVSLLVIVNLFILGIFAWWINKKVDDIEKCEDSTVTTKSAENQTFLVNHHSSAFVDREVFSYKTFQLEFPSEYSVITGDMWTPYETGGGMAQPELIFTPDQQPLGEDYTGGYVFVYVTEGIESIEEWDSLPFGEGETDYEIVEEETKAMGDFDIYERTISTQTKDENVFEAYIFLPEGVSYYFRTINNISKEDFYSIVESIKIRAFADLG